VGDRRFSNLPRKFKVSVSGCTHRCAQHEINDIGLVAVEKDGVVGYDVFHPGTNLRQTANPLLTVQAGPNPVWAKLRVVACRFANGSWPILC
jgi:sulfite reductase beta subunit-like hemoprotein